MHIHMYTYAHQATIQMNLRVDVRLRLFHSIRDYLQLFKARKANKETDWKQPSHLKPKWFSKQTQENSNRLKIKLGKSRAKLGDPPMLL